MKYAIICSELDPAGMNIKERLLEKFDFKEVGEFDDNPTYKLDNISIYTVSTKLILSEDLDRRIDADFFFFASKHVSKEGVASLTCHTPGNWGKAEYGGKDKELCIASALMLKRAYLEMKKLEEELPEHQITLEVTHHGPYLDKPCMFIEIGSVEEQWKDKKSGEIIANTIMKLIDNSGLENQRIVFGIGGTHYGATFCKVLERTDIAIGHICPKYVLSFLDEELIRKGIFRSKENVDFVLLDWKGLGKEKGRIVSLLEEMGIEYYRTDKILKN